MGLSRTFLSIIILSALLAMSGCLPGDLPDRQVAGAVNDDTGLVTGGTEGGTTGGDTTVPAAPQIEILHLVEPNITTGDYPTYYTGTGLSGAGTYVRKLTLPKNYSGYLYLGGINFNSLQNRFVRVRFTLGASRTPIEIPATVARAPGITPNTDIDVLVMDLRSQPFASLRLIYDLYDYRDYSDPDNAPVETNRDPSLYCRGLNLADDSTFDGQGACDGLAADGVTPLNEKCLYSYAKVVDRALTRVVSGVDTNYYPSQRQLDLTTTKSGYYHQTAATFLNRCLPDNSTAVNSTIVSGVSNATTATGMQDLSFNIFGQAGNLEQRNAGGATIYIQPVKYHGPFKVMNAANWEIKEYAAFGEYGLFDFTPIIVPTAGNLDAMVLHHSKLFPRFGYMNLLSGVKYLRTNLTALDTKTVTTMLSNGTSEIVDGCNLRVQSVNSEGHHIGSCNVTAKIEILAKNDEGTYVAVASTNEVVLQLARSTQISGEGSDYLYGNFNRCTNSNQCGSGECCYNNRCWSDQLVSQCLESATTTGNQPIGSTCTTDMQCGSLCCNSGTGKCAVHDNQLNPPVLCSKPIGQFCIAKEWCQQTEVIEWYIVKTGVDGDGNTTCAKIGYRVPKFGDCVQARCVAPPTPVNPPFDENDPNRCDNAVDPPTLPAI